MEIIGPTCFPVSRESFKAINENPSNNIIRF